MAARNTTVKARPSRAKSMGLTRKHSVRTPVTSLPQVVRDAIEIERERLMRAHTLLSCAAIAMDTEELSFGGPHYLTVIEMARDLVNHAINNLEPASLECASSTDDVPDDEFDDTAIGVAANNLTRRPGHVREPQLLYQIH
jgi:hypothetical protein